MARVSCDGEARMIALIDVIVDRDQGGIAQKQNKLIAVAA